MVVRATDASGCPVTLVIDGRADERVWSALTVIDDRDATVATDTAHPQRWAGWLYWGNIIQFLTAGGGDGVQLARSALDGFDPAQLAVAEGTGLAVAQRALALDEQTATWLGRTPEAPPVEAEVVDADPAWHTVLRLFDREESGLETLVQELLRRQMPAPVVGYELGDDGWPAELAWPDHRIAVLLAGPANDPEIADRDRAYAAAGWHARTAREWSADELAEQLDATSVRGRR
jgi:hypothetical protein